MSRFYLTTFLAAALLCAAACTESDPFSKQDGLTLTISAESATRIQLSSGLRTVFTEGDHLSVFRNSLSNSRWQFNGKTGDAGGKLSLVAEGPQADGTDYTVILYPYDADAVLTADTTVTTFYAGTQAYMPDSYGLAANRMIAAGRGDSFTLSNLCSYLNVRLAGTKKVKSITFSGGNHDILSGKATVDARTYDVVLTETAEDDDKDELAVKKVVLDCGEGVQLSEKDTTSFYIALPPHTFEMGFKAVVKYTDGTTMTKVTEACLAFERNVIYSMTDVTGKDSDIAVISIEPYSGETATDAANDIVGGDEDYYWEANDWSNKVTVVYSGSGATVTSSSAKILTYQTGAHVTVDMATNSVKNTEIIVKGKSADGSLKVYGEKKFKLTLAGVELASTTGPAINSQCKKRIFIHLQDGTTNRIADASKYTDDAYYMDPSKAADEDRKGTLFTEGCQIWSGTGVLVVSGNTKNAVATDDYFFMRPGVTLAIEDAASHAIKVKGDGEGTGFVMTGGLIYANVSSVAGKCLNCESHFRMTGGRMVLGTSGAPEYDSKENDVSAASCIKIDSTFTMDGGSIVTMSTGDGAKGISIDGDAVFNNGEVSITTSGARYSYTRNVTSSPKGLKADGNLTINGGKITINVTGNGEGAEGMESKRNLTINDGEIVINAHDDAINAKKDVTINGGRLYVYASNNDAIDSNGTMHLNGGLVIASGSSTPEEAFDCDKRENFFVTGGTLIGVAGGAIKPANSNVKQNILVYSGLKANTGELVSICDEAGKPVVAFTMPRSMSKGVTLFASSPSFIVGNYYTVKTGGTMSGYAEEWHGWYDGGTLTGGTQINSFAFSSSIKSVGSSGTGGFDGPGGRPGW